MKHIILGLVALVLLQTGCVQKAYDRTVVFTLRVSGIKGIQQVGIRGGGDPLSWQKDFPMDAVIPDSVYTATITKRTGYLWAEFKFTVNGEFELREQPNRRVTFSATSDTTYYEAVFNQAPAPSVALSSVSSDDSYARAWQDLIILLP